MNTAELLGEVAKTATVVSNDPIRPTVTLQLHGTVKSLVEIWPAERLSMLVLKGKGMQQEITVVNNADQPLAIQKVVSYNKNLSARLTTVEAGRKYKLTVRLDPNAPVGKLTDMVGLYTVDKQQPVIPVIFDLFVHDSISVSPLLLDFGAVRLEDLKNPSRLPPTASVLVTKTQGKALEINQLSCDLAMVKLEVTSVQKGRSYRINAILVKDKIEKRDAVQGHISAATNDTLLPEIQLSVSAKIL